MKVFGLEARLIINPLAGDLEKKLNSGNLFRRIPDYFESNEVYFPEESNLSSLMKRFLEEEVRVVVSLGGDGTNHKIISAALSNNYSPKFVFLGEGTMNLVKKYFTKKKAFDILEEIKNNYPLSFNSFFKKKRVLRINHLYGFYFGLGGPVEFIKIYNQEAKNNPLFFKKWPAIKAVTKSIFSVIFSTEYSRNYFQPFEAEVKVSDFVLDGKYHSYFAGTIRNIGLVFNPLFYAENDQGFHFLASQIKPLQVICHLGKLISGKPLPETKNFLVKEVQIRLPEEKTFLIDGDLYQGREIEISLDKEIEVFSF